VTGTDDVACKLDLSGHVAEKVVCLQRSGHELGDGLAMLGDEDGLTALHHLIHDGRGI
jgi:hypothetical protein